MTKVDLQARLKRSIRARRPVGTGSRHQPEAILKKRCPIAIEAKHFDHVLHHELPN